MNANESTTKSGRHNGVIAMILLLCPVCAFAQQKPPDVVYLKNGSIIYGSLSPAKDSNYIALQTGNNDVWVIPRSEVVKSGRAKTVFLVQKNGWYNTTSAGLFFGDDKGYQIESVVGYHFLYRYYAGAGVALDDYSFRTVPVFTSLSADLLKRKTTPFVYVNTGIVHPWPRSSTLIYGQKADKNKGGLYFDGGIGQKLRIDEKHSFQFSIGYSLAKFRFIFKQKDISNPNPDTETFFTNTYDYSFNRLVLKIGFTL